MLFDNTLGGILAIGSLVLGILVLTGHGDFIMKGPGSEQRVKEFDMEKLNRVSGLALLGFGIVTGIDCFTHTLPAKIGYLVGIAVIFGLYIYYVQKCRIKKK